MRVACGLHRGVERDRVGIVLGAAAIEHRRQSAPPPNQALLVDHETRVHVHRRHVRVLQVGDERDAGGPEPRVGFGAGNLLAEFGRELAEHGRDVHADLLEHAARASSTSRRRRRARRCDRCGSTACARTVRARDRRAARRPATRPRAPRTPRRYRRAASRTTLRARALRLRAGPLRPPVMFFRPCPTAVTPEHFLLTRPTEVATRARYELR